MIDLKLDPTSHDLVINSYDLQLIDQVDQIVQAVKMRLLTIFGEWFLDAREGVRYFDIVCSKNPDVSLIDSIMKATIVETPGVRELMSYSSTLNSSARTLSVTFQVNTDYGATDNITLGVV